MKMSTIALFVRFCKKFPTQTTLLKQSIQAASLMVGGDLISQSIQEKSFARVNLYRSIKFGSIGLILGPVLSWWYHRLDKVVAPTIHLAFVKRLALDQLVFAPSALACVTCLACITDGKNVYEIQNKLKRDYYHILLANWKVWPFVQCINFAFVPVHNRMLVVQFVAVGWNAYLSWRINTEQS